MLQANYGGIPGRLPTEETPAVDSCMTPNKRQNEAEEARSTDDGVSSRDVNADDVLSRDADDQTSARDVETDEAVEEVADKDDGDDAEPKEQHEGGEPPAAAAEDEEEVTEVGHRIFSDLDNRLMLCKLSW